MFDLVCRFQRAWVLTQALFLLSSCSSLFYYPDRYQHYKPEKYGLVPQETFFKSSDGTTLFSWFFKAATRNGVPPKGTIVQFHGNGENLSSHYLSLIWLVRHGYNLFTFDYRGYGRSEGEPDQEGTFQDGLAALETAHQMHTKSGAGVFVVYGQSLGGAIAMRSLGDFKKRTDVGLVVMDSTFMSYPRVARRKLASSFLTWIFSPLAHLLISNEYGSETAVTDNKIQLLVIHDKRDPAVDFINGQELFETATSKKDFWVLDRGEHVGIFQEDRVTDKMRFVKLLADLNSQRPKASANTEAP